MKKYEHSRHFCWLKLNKIHRCYTPPPLSNAEVQERIFSYSEIQEHMFNKFIDTFNTFPNFNFPIVPKD